MKTKLKALYDKIVQRHSDLCKPFIDTFEYRSKASKTLFADSEDWDTELLIELVTTKPKKNVLPIMPNHKIATLGVHGLWNTTQKAEFLVKCAIAETAPWYVKVEALRCLIFTKGDINWKHVESIVSDIKNGLEVKKPALDAVIFHNKTEFIAILKHLQSDIEKQADPYAHTTLFDRTRAALGDPEVLVQILEQTNDLWSNTRDVANNLLDDLIQSAGSPEIIARQIASAAPASMSGNIWTDLQDHDDSNVIKWAITQAPFSEAQKEKCLSFLAHKDWIVRNTAAHWVANNPSATSDLEKILGNPKCSRLQKSWAAYSYFLVGNSLDYLGALDDNIVKCHWEINVPSSIRMAIVKEYADHVELGSDIRYKLESHLSNYTYLTEEQDRISVIKSLEKAGLEIMSVQSAGEFYCQGSGTFWIITLSKSENQFNLYISTLGRFAYIDIQQSNLSELDIWELCQKTVKDESYIWIAEDIKSFVVPKLNIYFFGRRETLPIYDLLFYWQD